VVAIISYDFGKLQAELVEDADGFRVMKRATHRGEKPDDGDRVYIGGPRNCIAERALNDDHTCAELELRRCFGHDAGMHIDPLTSASSSTANPGKEPDVCSPKIHNNTKR
jgi:hypothetical protein